MSAIPKVAPPPRRAQFPEPPRVYRFSVDQYHQMIAADILGENVRVELLDGWIIEKMTHNPPHDATISLARRCIDQQLPMDWMLRIQSAITLEASEPEPDVAVVRGPERRYVLAHPKPGDIAQLTEVADNSLADDRLFKGPLYAAARIPIYWIINLIDRQVEVYTQPRNGKTPRYARRRDYGEDDSVPLVIGGKEIGRIPVKDLLP